MALDNNDKKFIKRAIVEALGSASNSYGPKKSISGNDTTTGIKLQTLENIVMAMSRTSTKVLSDLQRSIGTIGSSQIGSSAIKSLMESNPLTALLYMNKDLLGGAGKTLGSLISGAGKLGVAGLKGLGTGIGNVTSSRVRKSSTTSNNLNQPIDLQSQAIEQSGSPILIDNAIFNGGPNQVIVNNAIFNGGPNNIALILQSLNEIVPNQNSGMLALPGPRNLLPTKTSYSEIPDAKNAIIDMELEETSTKKLPILKEPQIPKLADGIKTIAENTKNTNELMKKNATNLVLIVGGIVATVAALAFLKSKLNDFDLGSAVNTILKGVGGMINGAVGTVRGLILSFKDVGLNPNNAEDRAVINQLRDQATYASWSYDRQDKLLKDMNKEGKLSKNNFYDKKNSMVRGEENKLVPVKSPVSGTCSLIEPSSSKRGTFRITIKTHPILAKAAPVTGAVVGAGGTIAAGALSGATAGSVVPGAGTASGAAIGATTALPAALKNGAIGYGAGAVVAKASIADCHFDWIVYPLIMQGDHVVQNQVIGLAQGSYKMWMDAGKQPNLEDWEQGLNDKDVSLGIKGVEEITDLTNRDMVISNADPNLIHWNNPESFFMDIAAKMEKDKKHKEEQRVTAWNRASFYNHMLSDENMSKLYKDQNSNWGKIKRAPGTIMENAQQGWNYGSEAMDGFGDRFTENLETELGKDAPNNEVLDKYMYQPVKNYNDRRENQVSQTTPIVLPSPAQTNIIYGLDAQSTTMATSEQLTLTT